MSDNKQYVIGDILKVLCQDGSFHFEKVVSVSPEIITEDMPPSELIDVSTQQLCDDFKYEVVKNHEIAYALHNNAAKLKESDCTCFGDHNGFMANPECVIHGSKQVLKNAGL
jgi:hypothetical protein